MVERWWAEAERNQVLPLDNRPFSELVFGRPPRSRPRARYMYWPGRAPVPESVAVNVRGPAPRRSPPTSRSPEGATSSRACWPCRARCSAAGRSTCSATAGSCYVHNLAGWRVYRVEAPIGALAPGDHDLAVALRRRRGSSCSVDGDGGRQRRDRADGVEPVLAHRRRAHRGLVAPASRRPTHDYRGPFAFTGTLDRVEIDVDGEAEVDPVAEANDVIAMQ